MDSISITKFEVGRFLARLRPPWPLLPVIDGSHLGYHGKALFASLTTATRLQAVDWENKQTNKLRNHYSVVQTRLSRATVL